MKNQVLNTLIPAATLALFCAATHAQQAPNAPLGPYISASLGSMAIGASDNGLNEAALGSSKNGLGFKASAGFMFATNFGVEVGGFTASNLGKSYFVGSQTVAQRGDVTAYHLSGVGRIPLGQNWALNGKLGVAQGRYSGTNALPSGANILGKKTGVLLGFGGEYRFTSNVALVFDLDVLPTISDRATAAMFSIGVKANF